MKLYGKKWDGEWEPAAASWFKTPLGWRLAYGTPLPDVPMGGLTPDWTEVRITWINNGSDNFCADGQTENGNSQFKCKYSGYKDKPMCQAQWYVTNRKFTRCRLLCPCVFSINRTKPCLRWAN